MLLTKGSDMGVIPLFRYVASPLKGRKYSATKADQGKTLRFFPLSGGTLGDPTLRANFVVT